MRFRLDLTDVADDELETAIIKIPKQVTELDLSQNRLDIMFSAYEITRKCPNT